MADSKVLLADLMNFMPDDVEALIVVSKRDTDYKLAAISGGPCMLIRGYGHPNWRAFLDGVDFTLASGSKEAAQEMLKQKREEGLRNNPPCSSL